MIQRLESTANKILLSEGDDRCRSPCQSSVNKLDGFSKATKAKIVAEETRRPWTRSLLRKKVVSFYDKVKVKSISSYESYSQEEVGASWYTDEEYANFRQHCIGTLCLMMTGGFKETAEYCPRGLEDHLFRDSANETQKLRHQMARRVLIEQAVQTKWGVYMDDRIRDSVVLLSEDSKTKACERGAEDAKAALECYLNQ